MDKIQQVRMVLHRVVGRQVGVQLIHDTVTMRANGTLAWTVWGSDTDPNKPGQYTVYAGPPANRVVVCRFIDTNVRDWHMRDGKIEIWIK